MNSRAFKLASKTIVYVLAAAYILELLWPLYVRLVNPGYLAFERGLKNLAEVQAFIPTGYEGTSQYDVWLWDGGYLGFEGKLSGDPSTVFDRFVGQVGEFGLWCRREYDEHPSWDGAAAPLRDDLERLMGLKKDLSVRDMVENYDKLLAFVSQWPREPGTNRISVDDPESDHRITDCWTEKASVRLQDWIGPYDGASIFGRTRYIYVKEPRPVKKRDGATCAPQGPPPASATADSCPATPPA
ncbi:MAG: hypothetical protein ABL957_12775 [Parvularculaceae bacterium]